MNRKEDGSRKLTDKKSTLDIKYNVTLTDEQKLAKEKILNSAVTFLHGLPGTAKTFTACAVAIDMLFKKMVDKIIITRPTIGTEDNGFLPGTLEEKLEPWLVPIRHNFRQIYNKPDKWKQLESDGVIEIVSLSHFRGRTMANSVCILDEYQNLSKSQLQMAIGRLGKGSIMIFCGDETQIDLKVKSDSAIWDSKKLESSKHVSIIELKENHRHEAVSELLNLLK